MSLPEFKLLRPRTLDEAVNFLASYGGSAPVAGPSSHVSRGGIQIVAGGTDLLPSMRQKLFEPEYLLDIRQIEDLRGIRQLPDGGLEIGALTTLTAIEDSGTVAARYPVLREAVATVASPLLRNMGTLGGNLCLDTRCLWYNQSLTWRKSCGFCIKKDGDLCHVAPGGSKCWAAFSGDTAPALLCLDAEVEIAGPRGRRRVPLRDFYRNVGDDHRALDRNELLTRVILPASSAGWRGAYLKLRVRGSIDYPLAGVAVAIKANGHIEAARVAVTAVNPAPLLVKGVDQVLVGKPSAEIGEEAAAAVGELAARTAKPLTTSALTPEYRREIVRVYAKRAVLRCLKG